MQEEWRDIAGYEGLYQVSNFGRVKSLERKIKYPNGTLHTYHERILRVYVTKNGYSSVALGKGGQNTRFNIHRLVAKSFLENRDHLPQVNHIDGDKNNNNVCNLEWCTASDNIKHMYRELGMLPSRRKKVRCVETQEVFNSITDAAKSVEISRESIRDCVNGRQNTCRGLHWIAELDGGSGSDNPPYIRHESGDKNQRLIGQDQ